MVEESVVFLEACPTKLIRQMKMYSWKRYMKVGWLFPAGDDDGQRTANYILYRWYWEHRGLDGEAPHAPHSLTGLHRDYPRSARGKEAVQDDMSCLRVWRCKCVYTEKKKKVLNDFKVVGLSPKPRQVKTPTRRGRKDVKLVNPAFPKTKFSARRVFFTLFLVIHWSSNKFRLPCWSGFNETWQREQCFSEEPEIQRLLRVTVEAELQFAFSSSHCVARFHKIQPEL